jgi:hypothetical protein
MVSHVSPLPLLPCRRSLHPSVLRITCYVWMTALNLPSYLKGDYGSIRVMQMPVRFWSSLCFLLTQGTTTFSTTFACCTPIFSSHGLRQGSERIHHTKGGRPHQAGLFGTSPFTLFGIWILPFPLAPSSLGRNSHVGSWWRSHVGVVFQIQSDHWSTFLGMIFALNFPLQVLFANCKAQPCYGMSWAKVSVFSLVCYTR